MTGKEFADLIAAYIVANFEDRGVAVYREVAVGKSIIGKNRRIDMLVIDAAGGRALAIECKYQESQGTADEKIPYALDDVAALRMPGCVVYAGEGFSEGVLHMLQASEISAYCLPSPDDLSPSRATSELDHLLAVEFRWWDVLIGKKKPFSL